MLYPPYNFLTYTNIPPPLLYVTTKPKPNHDPIYLNLYRTNIYPTHYTTLPCIIFLSTIIPVPPFFPLIPSPKTKPHS